MKSQDSLPFYEQRARTNPASLSTDRGELAPFLDELNTNSRVLDLGCGVGRDLWALQSAGQRAVGVEASPEIAALARKLVPQAEIWQKDFLFLSLKEAEWDGIWANRSLHHFEPEAVQRVVAGAFKGLVRGGVLGVIVYEGEGAFEDRGNDLTGPSRWVHPFTENALCSMIEQSGFKIKKIGRQEQGEAHPLSSLLVIANKI